ncbi:MAG: hypothetical protein MUF61_03585 [archaeon]|nr:hypothetical protein [archaeon]
MSVINKIFSKKFDEEVHSDFVKFSKGEFNDRYLVEGKKQKDRWSIKTSAEFANFLVRKCLQNVKGKIPMTGAIICTMDISKDADLPVEKVKQFMGVKQLVINGEVEADKIIRIMDKYPRAFFALTFSAGNSDLKIKAKAPKSAKPASGGEKEPKAEFCSLKTGDKSIIDDLFFDIKDFKEIAIKHVIKITDIILPKGETDPAKVRELAKRKGVVIRKITADSRQSVKEAPFEA